MKMEYQVLDDGIYTMEQGYRRESFIVHTGRQAGDVESAGGGRIWCGSGYPRTLSPRSTPAWSRSPPSGCTGTGG